MYIEQSMISQSNILDAKVKETKEKTKLLKAFN